MHCCLNDRFLEFLKSRLYAVCDQVIYNDFSQLTPEVAIILIPGSDRLLELFAFTFRYYKIRHFSNFVLIYLEKGRIFAVIEIIIYIVWYEFSGKGNWGCMFLRFVAGLICGWKIYSAYVARSGCNCGPQNNKPFDLPEWPKPWCKLHPLHRMVLYRRSAHI